ncbi:O-antigen ligase family protein [Flocculibacter collagenilyticus]|uniref:O-antigen ligase family protein n=1 Tax=Flocculibacter collagenilyticus TaxID=2744479 RepID=UPI0018F51D35|nr:O-antigen ligase family protein [Flocculibacter collagenilyticus]
MDMIISDFYPFILLPFFFLYGLKIKSKAIFLLPLVAIGYYLGIAIVASFTEYGSIGNLASSLRFSKQFLLIPCGALLFTLYGWRGVKSFSSSIIFILCAILLSDLIYGSWPRGCGYEGRWGGCLAKFEVYGFPNSSTSYIVLLSLTLILFHHVKLISTKLLTLALLISAFIALLSISRSAWVFITTGLFFTFLVSINIKRKVLYLYILSILIILLFAFDWNLPINTSLFDGVLNKFNYYTAGNEITSGRTDIWLAAASLILHSPLFGFGFNYFSIYMPQFDTPHQQYLELLFKSGIIGFSIYMYCIYLFCIKFKQLCFNHQVDIKLYKLMLMSVLLPLLINGLFQPIFSYSLMGNFFMFALGFAIEATKSIEEL